MDGTTNRFTGHAGNAVLVGRANNVYVNTPRTTLLPTDRLIAEWDPFALGIHRAITVNMDTAPAMAPLPAYLPRDHDYQLDAVLRDIDSSLMVVLVGSSSTGKTRALYEAVSRHAVLHTWPVRRPRTSGQLLDNSVPPNTVVWLDEVQDYLNADVAAHLQSLLDGPGPVVVLGTLWPGYWRSLTAAATGHAPARRLLLHQAHRIEVAERFVDTIPRSADPRLREAVRTAGERRTVIQTLAGGPLLVERYEHPRIARDRYVKAVLTAAVDARRLGHNGPLPAALLKAGACAYLGDDDRIDTPDDWFLQGMNGAVHDSAHGITALVRIRTEPGPGLATGYQLHDYLYEQACTSRDNELTTAVLWDALAAHADGPDDRMRLADAARSRMLYRYSEALYPCMADLRTASIWLTNRLADQDSTVTLRQIIAMLSPHANHLATEVQVAVLLARHENRAHRQPLQPPYVAAANNRRTSATYRRPSTLRLAMADPSQVGGAGAAVWAYSDRQLAAHDPSWSGYGTRTGKHWPQVGRRTGTADAFRMDEAAERLDPRHRRGLSVRPSGHVAELAADLGLPPDARAAVDPDEGDEEAVLAELAGPVSLDSAVRMLLPDTDDGGEPTEYRDRLCDRAVRGDRGASLLLQYQARKDELPESDHVLRYGLEPDGSLSRGNRHGEGSSMAGVERH